MPAALILFILFSILCPKNLQMSLAAKMINIAKYPLTIGLLCAAGVVVIMERFAYLVHKHELHKLELRIRVELCLIFFLFSICYNIIMHWLRPDVA